MSGHAIRWEYDHWGVVAATAVCHEPAGADCRLTSAGPECDCETWGRIERRNDGTIWHELTEGHRDLTLPRDEPQWHQVKPDDECNVCEFLNADPSYLAEMSTQGHPSFVIAETTIEPVWDFDSYLWRKA